MPTISVEALNVSLNEQKEKENVIKRQYKQSRKMDVQE